jgi:hypothetical protein
MLMLKAANGRERMTPDDLGFDVDRYRKLLAEATDEKKRLALIELLIEEQAKERLGARSATQRDATTAATVAEASQRHSQTLPGGPR